VVSELGLNDSRPCAEGRCGLILATTKGNIEEQVAWMRHADAEADAGAATDRSHSEGEHATIPTLGAEAARLAGAAGALGPAYAVSAACASGLIALIDAAIMLLSDEAERMVVIAADEDGDFVADGFRALRAISPSSCKPFDRGRDGLALGPAAAGCVLGSGLDLPLCMLSGWGISNDATHMTAPDATGVGLIRAIREALAMAGLAPGQIDVYFAHGTATRYNDAMEMRAVESIFCGSGGKGPAITGVKGLIGHTLGASGLIECALAVRMLQRQIAPGVVGLRTTERADFDFVTASRSMKIRHILKVASGFGGINAAVVLSLPTDAAF
jgi:3-oxoacyl-[acyl-carrier-protein] synthase II